MFSEIKNDKNEYRNLINGAWRGSMQEEYIDIPSPVKEGILGRVPSMTHEEVDEAIKVAHEAQKSWRRVSVHERADIFYNVAKLLVEEKEELSDILMLEIGKDKKSCVSEVERTADFINFTADSARTMLGESIQADMFKGYDDPNRVIVSREPLGVVLAISPFNYPINLAASKIAPALIVGNSVVFKPATQGSISGLHLARVFQKAGIPDGVINTVTGRGTDIGDYIITHKGIDFINFTGSSAVGSRISQLSKMVPLMLELGGKDAAIVLEDANMKLAADEITAGAFSYSGQRCTAIKRVLVVDEVADELVSIIKDRIDKLHVGNPLDMAKTDIVPLINTKAADFVMELIEDAKCKGSKIVTGGTRKGNLILPTLLDNVTGDMRVAWEEPFGPVLPIIRVKDIDEAIQMANASEYGLQSSVFTENINSALIAAERLEVGVIHINNKTERGPDHFPFLGVKASGLGTQGIRYSIEAMSRPKGTVIHVY